MKNFYHKHKRIMQDALIIVLALLFAASLAWFVTSFDQSYRAGDLRPEYHPSKKEAAVPSEPQHTVTIDTIKPWMTFNYLNVVFKLPAGYLQNALALTDSRYPNIRIDTYARKNRLDQAFFLQNVKQAITSYSYNKNK